MLLDPAVGLDGGWMREIADDMFASPDYTDRAEARDEKVNGSWGEVDDAELDRELDEHLIDLPDGRVRLADQHPRDDVLLERARARHFVVPRNGIPTTLVRATQHRPAVCDRVTHRRAGGEARPAILARRIDCDHMVPQAKPAETAALIRDSSTRLAMAAITDEQVENRARARRVHPAGPGVDLR